MPFRVIRPTKVPRRYEGTNLISEITQEMRVNRRFSGVLFLLHSENTERRTIVSAASWRNYTSIRAIFDAVRALTKRRHALLRGEWEKKRVPIPELFGEIAEIRMGISNFRNSDRFENRHSLLACRATDSKWHAGQELDSQFVKVRRCIKNMSVTLCIMTENQPENFTGDFEKLISAGLFPDFFMEQTDTTIARK